MAKRKNWEELVARAKELWRDLRITRKQWDAMFPQDVRDEARHTMSLDELRLRG